MKKEVKIIGAIAIVFIVVGLVYFAYQQNKTKSLTTVNNSGSAVIPKKMLTNQGIKAAKKTQSLISEVIKDGANASSTIKSIPVTSLGTTTTSTPQAIKVVQVSPGTSPIDINSGQVVTELGQAVDNEAQAASGDAPQQSVPISAKDLPKSTIKLQVTSDSFTPKTFTVNKGQVVSLAVSNVNKSTFSEVFRFDDSSLKGVVLGLAKGETKTITFNAPTKAGEYVFYSSMFNHRALGAIGKMIVK